MLIAAAAGGCGGDDSGRALTVRDAPPIDRAASPPRTSLDREEVAKRVREQRPHHGRAARSGEPRAAVLADLQRAILADARARDRRGELDGPFRRTRCTRREDAESSAGVVVYTCLAVTSESPKTRLAPAIALGQPFLARVDYDRGRFAWCKTTPVAAEGATPRPERVVPVSAVCGGSGAG